MASSEVDESADEIPIRDASEIGNSKHKKILISEFKKLAGGGVPIIVEDREPTTSDIAEGTSSIWLDTVLNQVRHWANIGGVLFFSTLWATAAVGDTTADSTTITADDTSLTADLT